MDIRRREFLKSSGAAAALVAGSALGAGPIMAAQAKAGRQVPGIYRIAVGDIEVTALLDGYIDLGINLFSEAAPEEIERLQADSFLPAGDMIRSAVNCFVVNTGDKLVIVDAGGRNLLGPSMGKLPQAMTAAGIDPAAVDVVVATHMHPDHIGGILTRNGAAVFPNAEFVVHEADWDFWMSPELMAKAQEAAKPFFEAAQAAATPYVKRTRKIGNDQEIVPGIRSLVLPGHTPGHTGFVVSSGKDTMLIWGDVVHSVALQFPHPEWSIAFDIAPDIGIVTRRKAFDMAATDRLMIAGMHVPFPGIGHVVRDGGYRFIPEQWRHSL